MYFDVSGVIHWRAGFKSYPDASDSDENTVIDMARVTVSRKLMKIKSR